MGIILNGLRKLLILALSILSGVSLTTWRSFRFWDI